MEQITTGVSRIESSPASNGFVLDHPDGVVVIDPGLPFTSRRVIGELRKAGVLERVRHVLLTHYDLDHAGAAKAVSRATGAPVWIGGADIDVLDHRVWVRTPFRITMGVLPPSAAPQEVHRLDGVEEILPGLAVIPTPGHTPGHHSFAWRNALFVGDAANVTASGELVHVPKPLISDYEEASKTLAVLRKRPEKWLLSGHSKPARRAGTW